MRLDVLDLFSRRPNVLQENLAAINLSKRLGLKVNIDSSSDGIRNDQWRRGQIVGASARVDTAFEVSVAAEHTNCHQVVLSRKMSSKTYPFEQQSFDTLEACLLYDFGNDVRQRSAVSNTGHATIADDIETVQKDEFRFQTKGETRE